MNTSNRHAPRLTSYQDADLILGRANARKIGHNTYLERLYDGVIAVRLHRTNIVKFAQDGRTVLDSGGWRTVTTKERMNRYLPAGYRLASTKGVWYLHYLGAIVDAFYDGLMIHDSKQREVI